MIKANELRIGNLVYFNDIIVEIATISNTGEELNIAYYDSVGMYDYIDIRLLKPIPLTRERLIRFGFETFQYGGQGNITNTGTLKDIEVCLIDNTIYRGGSRAINYKLEYVHQLQNFYFATENEELKIK